MSEKKSTVLLVDDEPAVGMVLAALLAQANVDSIQARSGEEALEVLGRRHVDVVVSDVRMPGMGGMQLLSKLSERWPDLPVVMLTAHGSVPMAVEAMKAGAADFVLKPFDREELLYTIRKALERGRHQAEEGPGLPRAAGFVSRSQAMEKVHDLIRRAASGTATVLIRGESGTGKELAAQAVHQLSPRKDGPFVRVHSAALPDSLMESELFGYEKGAFTGAVARKPGRVELASGGTLLLDEIGDVSLVLQVKLLRLLQEKEFERLGGTQTLKADVRFVVATHRNLEEMVKKGEFREDLFYRLNVVPVWIPPLRERPEDIPLLVEHFLATLGAANGRPGVKLGPGAMELLVRESWPGNVRQLQNLIERLVVLADGGALTAGDVERELGRKVPLPGELLPRELEQTPGSGSLDERLRETEKEALVVALRQSKNNRTQAARILGVSRRTLYNKLEEHGLV